MTGRIDKARLRITVVLITHIWLFKELVQASFGTNSDMAAPTLSCEFFSSGL